jgi:hypothetical protein
MIRYYFPDSTFENPLGFFEYAYSKKGLDHLRREFLSIEYDPDLELPDIDLDKEPVNQYFSDGPDEEPVIVTTWYRDYLSSKLFEQKKKSLELFKKRLDSCNSADEEKYVLKKFQKILIRISSLIQHNSIPLKKGNLKFIDGLIKDLERTYEYRTGISSKSIEQTAEEKLKLIVAGLISEIDFIDPAMSDEMMDFLLVANLSEFNRTIKVSCDNRQFQYVLTKFLSLGYPCGFSVNEIINHKIFLRSRDGKPYTLSNIYNVSSKNKSTNPKKFKEINKIFSQFYDEN